MPNTAPAYTIGGITRPELFFDANGNIILTPAAEQFAETYGLKALYLGLPPSTPWPPVAATLATPTDTASGPAVVAEGAAANTATNDRCRSDDRRATSFLSHLMEQDQTPIWRPDCRHRRGQQGIAGQVRARTAMCVLRTPLGAGTGARKFAR